MVLLNVAPDREEIPHSLVETGSDTCYPNSQQMMEERYCVTVYLLGLLCFPGKAVSQQNGGAGTVSMPTFLSQDFGHGVTAATAQVPVPTCWVSDAHPFHADTVLDPDTGLDFLPKNCGFCV